jgi:hypothetical protein
LLSKHLFDYLRKPKKLIFLNNICLTSILHNSNKRRETMKSLTKKLHKQRTCSRRSLLKGAGVGIAGLSLAGMVGAPIEEQVAYATQNVKRSSSPSQLRITDLRIQTCA